VLWFSYRWFKGVEVFKCHSVLDAQQLASEILTLHMSLRVRWKSGKSRIRMKIVKIFAACTKWQSNGIHLKIYFDHKFSCSRAPFEITRFLRNKQVPMFNSDVDMTTTALEPCKLSRRWRPVRLWVSNLQSLLSECTRWKVNLKLAPEQVSKSCLRAKWPRPCKTASSHGVCTRAAYFVAHVTWLGHQGLNTVQWNRQDDEKRCLSSAQLCAFHPYTNWRRSC